MHRYVKLYYFVCSACFVAVDTSVAVTDVISDLTIDIIVTIIVINTIAISIVMLVPYMRLMLLPTSHFVAHMLHTMDVFCINQCYLANLMCYCWLFFVIILHCHLHAQLNYGCLQNVLRTANDALVLYFFIWLIMSRPKAVMTLLTVSVPLAFSLNLNCCNSTFYAWGDVFIT